MAVKYFFEKNLAQDFQVCAEIKVKTAFTASDAEWAGNKCQLTREYLARREREC